jgi:PAS domain S-box-containing protein
VGKYGWFELVALPLALAVLAIAILFVYRDGDLYRSAREDAQKAERVVSIVGSLLSDTKDAETGQRGYLLTGKSEYLEPYNSALSAIERDLRQLKEQVTEPASIARLLLLERVVNDKLAELQATIDLRRKGELAASQTIVLGGSGKAAMDQIRALGAALDQSVRGRMIASEERAEASAGRVRWISVAALLTIFLLLCGALISITLATQKRQALIRELDRSQKETAAARDTLELTLRSIGDAVVSTDEKGTIQFINAAARNLTGWGDTSAIGQPLPRVFRIIHEKTRDTVENPVEKVIRVGRVVGLANHTLLIDRNGKEIPIDDSAAPIHDSTGSLIGVVLVFRDVSERRRAEKEIEAGRAELARSNEALLRSNTDLERFAYAVSHDLQEPLRTIASFTQLLLRDISSPKAPEYMGFVMTGVNRMKDLIRDLLEYSRITHSQLSALQPVDFQEVLGEVLWNLQTLISTSGAHIINDGLPTAVATRRAMVQLVQNLIGNAIKYTKGRKPEVHVGAERRENGDWVFHVRDNGIGLDMARSEEIFEVFKRLHGNQEYGGGTGIGLAICKRIVELHGGTIWVDSQPGEGSSFLFTLPSPDRVTVEDRTATADSANG